MQSQQFLFRESRDRWRVVRPALAAALAIAASAIAWAGPSSAAEQRTVPATEQRARDSDRVEVLRQELKKSEDLLASLARRKAERLAASDAPAAAEAEEQHRRTLSDVAALKRELALTARQVTTPNADPSSVQPVLRPAAPVAATPKPASPPTSSPTPWWDVYGRGRTPPATSSVSQAPAAVPAPTPVSGRRLE